MATEAGRCALLVGATGLIGSALLSELQQSGYRTVYVLARHPERVAPAANVAVYDFHSGLPESATVDDYYCALGTTRKQAGSDGLRQVDKELVVACARLALQHGAHTASIVSAIGADPLSWFLYNRLKGEMEQQVERLGFHHCLFWQPSILLGQRQQKRGLERLAGWLLSSALFANYQALPGQQIARAMAIFSPRARPGVTRLRVKQIKQLSH